MITKKRGCLAWIPPAVNVEIQDIKREENINSNVGALNKLVNYARVGREVGRLSKLNPGVWKNKIKLPSVNSFDITPVPFKIEGKRKKRKK